MSIMDGKVALVTRGSSEIGKASAIAFARLGAKVVVAARRENEGEETVRLIQKAGSEGRFIQTDVSKTAEIERLFDANGTKGCVMSLTRTDLESRLLRKMILQPGLSLHFLSKSELQESIHQTLRQQEPNCDTWLFAYDYARFLLV